jgi:hypothetical protein
MGARNRVGIGLSYRPARLHSLADLVPGNRFLGSLKFKNSGSRCYPYHKEFHSSDIHTSKSMDRYYGNRKADVARSISQLSTLQYKIYSILYN